MPWISSLILPTEGMIEPQRIVPASVGPSVVSNEVKASVSSTACVVESPFETTVTVEIATRSFVDVPGTKTATASPYGRVGPVY